MMERQIQIAQPSMGDDEWNAVRESISSGWVTQGPKVKAFEAAFAERHQVAHGLAVSSCTTGLHLRTGWFLGSAPTARSDGEE